MNKNFRSEVKERINHVLFLMTKFENKIKSKERKEITIKLKDLLKEYVESRKRKVHKKIIEGILRLLISFMIYKNSIQNFYIIKIIWD